MTVKYTEDHEYIRIEGTTGIVGLYEAFRDEIHPGEVARRLAAGGRRLALPATPKFGQPLVFRAWAPGDPLVQGRMNIPEPSPDAPEVFPQVLLVPPVAFDRRGYRIGYGAGFYDRTIASLSKRPVTIGVGFELQRMDTIHPQPHDIPLDYILTEDGVVREEIAGP